ncbi:MAG: hypothetical protein DFNUSKGM_002623 [Candidatus Fervidibacter sacchari]
MDPHLAPFMFRNKFCHESRFDCPLGCIKIFVVTEGYGREVHFHSGRKATQLEKH